MRELTELLDSVLGQTTFDSRSAEKITPGQLRDAFESNGWHDDEIISAREAEPNIPDELLSQLNNCLRSLLKEYITSGHLRFGLGQAQETDFIGHAFPINEHGHPISYIPPKMIFCPNYFDLAYISRVSTVADFTRGVIKGAAVLGSERVTHLLSDWLEGKPVKYGTSALLNGPPVKAPLNPVDGAHIEPLPLSSDRLDASLPRRRGTSGNGVFDYLGRTLVSIDSEVKPALFRPETRPSAQDIQVKPIGGVNIATVCQALSLESDDYVDAGLYWNDYQELDAFSLGVDETTWFMGNAGVRSWSSPVTWRTDWFTGVTTLEFNGEQPMLDISEEQLARTFAALKALKDSHKSRIAVSRWAKSKDSGEPLVDRFIDLRIALECLYVQDFLDAKQTQEMRFKLSLFGAWHLGSDFDERKRIRKKLRQVYDAASKAVHSGDLEYFEYQQLLSTAQDLCRRGILKLLREGPPRDWGDLILGIENE